MPLVFKDEKREPIVITHDDVKLYFEISPGRQRQARINTMIQGGMRDFGVVCNEALKTALTKWEGVVDKNDKPIPFSIPIRDWLIEEAGIITDDDALLVLGLVPEKKTDTEAVADSILTED